MKKWSFFAATLLITQALFSTTVFATEPSVSFQVRDDEPIILNDSQKIISAQKHEKNQALNYSIDITYPQIQGKHLTEAEKAFNQRILSIVDDESKNFINTVKIALPHTKTLPEELQFSQFHMDYNLDVVQPIISVRILNEVAQAGRAHPFHSHRVVNFDLAQNKELALSDLFKPKSDYLKTISELSAAELNKKISEKDQWMIKNGAEPLLNNYKNWNIGKNALLITFDEYQVAPYVYGPQAIEIPLKALENLLSPQGKIISQIG